MPDRRSDHADGRGGPRSPARLPHRAGSARGGARAPGRVSLGNAPRARSRGVGGAHTPNASTPDHALRGRAAVRRARCPAAREGDRDARGHRGRARTSRAPARVERTRRRRLPALLGAGPADHDRARGGRRDGIHRRSVPAGRDHARDESRRDRAHRRGDRRGRGAGRGVRRARAVPVRRSPVRVEREAAQGASVEGSRARRRAASRPVRRRDARAGRPGRHRVRVQEDAVIARLVQG